MTRPRPTTDRFVAAPGAPRGLEHIHPGDNVRWTTRDGFREGRLLEWRPGGACLVMTRGSRRVLMPHRVRGLQHCPDQYNRRRLAARSGS